MGANKADIKACPFCGVFNPAYETYCIACDKPLNPDIADLHITKYMLVAKHVIKAI